MKLCLSIQQKEKEKKERREAVLVGEQSAENIATCGRVCLWVCPNLIGSKGEEDMSRTVPIHQSSQALPIGFLSCDHVCQYSKLGIICDLRLNQGPKQADLLLGHKFFSGPLTSHVSNSVEGQESIHSSFSSGHKMIFVFMDTGGKLKHKK